MMPDQVKPDVPPGKAMQLDLVPLPILSDNYVWILSRTETKAAVIVDPGDARPVAEFLDRQSLSLEAILVTHHHWDHVGGISVLKKHYGSVVYGPAGEAIDGIDVRVSGGDRVKLPSLQAEFATLDLPGHTAGHVGYSGNGLLFCGDTLFSAGCGRLFEGTAAQLHASLGRIAELPDETRICCTHEYTLSNLHFAQEVEPGNPDITAYTAKVEGLMRRREASLPSTLGWEKRINPFLRTAQESVCSSVASHAGRAMIDELDCFAELRKWKDSF
jgi:hydroxyacylglutathione hydrolase